jgi:hypothetical protein
MKKILALILVLLVWCCTTQAREDPPIKKTVKADVEEMNKAVIKENFARMVDFTHPKAVELLGGREKMISIMESGTREMKAKGFTFLSVKVEEPSDPVPAGPELFLVVPFVLEMKSPGGRMIQKTCVVGVSSDKGQTWKYVNGDQNRNRLKMVLPTLPDLLKLPEHQDPMLQKD